MKDGLGSIKRSGVKNNMSKLKGLGDVKTRGGKRDPMNIKSNKGLSPKGLKGLPRVTKGGWSEYVESFNKTSGSERQAYRSLQETRQRD